MYKRLASHQREVTTSAETVKQVLLRRATPDMLEANEFTRRSTTNNTYRIDHLVWEPS